MPKRNALMINCQHCEKLMPMRGLANHERACAKKTVPAASANGSQPLAAKIIVAMITERDAAKTAYEEKQAALIDALQNYLSALKADVKELV